MNLVGQSCLSDVSLLLPLSCAHTQSASESKSDNLDSSYTLETAQVVEVLSGVFDVSTRTSHTLLSGTVRSSRRSRDPLSSVGAS